MDIIVDEVVPEFAGSRVEARTKSFRNAVAIGIEREVGYEAALDALDRQTRIGLDDGGEQVAAGFGFGRIPAESPGQARRAVAP